MINWENIQNIPNTTKVLTLAPTSDIPTKPDTLITPVSITTLTIVAHTTTKTSRSEDNNFFSCV